MSLDWFLILQDISNVSPWSQITAQFNLFNSGSSNSSTPSASTAGRRLLHKPDHLGQAAAMQAADDTSQSSAGRNLLQTANSSYPDFEAADTTTSDLTKEGRAHKADQIVCERITQLVMLFVLINLYKCSSVALYAAGESCARCYITSTNTRAFMLPVLHSCLHLQFPIYQ